MKSTHSYMQFQQPTIAKLGLLKHYNLPSANRISSSDHHRPTTRAHPKLLTNDYVGPNSDAFDTVRFCHHTLSSHAGTLDLPDRISNWLINYLNDGEAEEHTTNYLGKPPHWRSYIYK